MQGDVHKASRKAAFTLAEVLITLGIIGVVAALTMPTLIAQHRKKALQVALLKTYSELQQANLKLLADDIHLYDIDSVVERRDLLMKEFNGSSAVNGDDSWTTIAWNLHVLYNGGLRSHDGKHSGLDVHPLCDNGGIWTDNIGRLWLFNDSDKQICVDVNGVKGPNRYGYDYFVFYPTKDDKIAPHYSDKNSEWFINDGSLTNYSDYTFYAVTNQHPTEKGKTYWGDYIKF